MRLPVALLTIVITAGCTGEPRPDADAALDQGGTPEAPGTPTDASALSHADFALDFDIPAEGATDTIAGGAWTEADWTVFTEVVREATAAGLPGAPLGEAIGALGRGFVGFPYTPHTLESSWMDGREVETLVVNLREFDCVTFVENVLALTWFVRNEGVGVLQDPEAARSAFEGYLTDLRYRGGEPDGYASRLHYFSEWLTHNATDGRLELITTGPGVVPDSTAIDFMSTHVDAYPALAGDRDEVERIRRAETALSGMLPRLFVPENRIAGFAGRVRTGDVIAATSTVPGLDIAHTGIALRVDGVLKLMHAPLVGSEVQISETSLAERILRIEAQDGIMVGRPLPKR